MKPRINVITLAVDDLDKTLVFYRDGLGLQGGIVERAKQAGATLTDPAHDRAFGNLFRLLSGFGRPSLGSHWNPGLEVTD